VARAARQLGGTVRRRAARIAGAVGVEVHLAVVVVVEAVVAHHRAVLVGVVGARAARVVHVDEAVAVVVDAVPACAPAARLLRIGQAVAVVILAVAAARRSVRTLGLARGLGRILVVAVLYARAHRPEAHAIAVMVRARGLTEALRARVAEGA